MADLADIANDKNDELVFQALSNRPSFDQASAYECRNCGDEIPAQRRALGNVKLCIDCQTAVESNSKHYRF